MVERVFFDSFDWRLYQDGGMLVQEQEHGRTRSKWLRLTDNQLMGMLMAKVPRFPRDLPEGPMRQRLVPLLEMRALLPLVKMKSQVYRAAVLDKQLKTVLRLSVELGCVHGNGNSITGTLPPRFNLEPVKGYIKPVLKAQTVLEHVLRLEPAVPLLDEALSIIGRRAGDYTGKIKVDLSPELPAGEAVRRILLNLLETLERNLEGARADYDSEFLHDFRVAVRRTRSLFSQVKGVLPADALNRFRPGFKWLGQITGSTRDLDVYLLKLPVYREALPNSMQDDLDPLKDYLERHQKIEQRQLAKLLDSARFKHLCHDWRMFLEKDLDYLSWSDKASKPILNIANRQIWKTYKQVLREGEAINVNSAAEALHELRITCKKLRYLMEFFQTLYPEGKIRALIKALKLLQDNLGDFQDLEVQADALRGFGHQMKSDEADLPGEVFMAMGVLIDNLHQGQQAERQKFADRFASFARPKNRKLCSELFNLRGR
jgi:CHAD domain-containing protein